MMIRHCFRIGGWCAFCMVIAWCTLTDVAGGQPAGRFPGSEQAAVDEDADDTAALLAGLRKQDSASFTAALEALTRDANTTMTNLPVLLPEARQAAEPLGRDLITPGTWWSRCRTRGALILAHIAESFRQIMDEAQKMEALQTLKPFVRETLAGQVPGVSPVCALYAYYYCVFYPSEPGPLLAPDQGPAVDDVLSLVREALDNADLDIRSNATDLALLAAYTLPAQREELLSCLTARGSEKEAGGFREMMAYMLQGGEALTKAGYAVIQQESEEELLDRILHEGAGRTRNARLQLLKQRLPTSPSRIDIIRELIADCSVLGVCGLVPGPIPLTASESEKQFIDDVIPLFEAEIARKRGPGEGTPAWVPKALRRLIAPLDVDELKRGRRMPEPYARDRVIDVLLRAVKAEDPRARTAAASELANVCWIGPEAARKVLTGLRPCKQELEQSPAFSRTDGKFPLGVTLEECPEKWMYGDVTNAIRQAEEALKTFGEPIPEAAPPAPTASVAEPSPPPAADNPPAEPRP